MIGRLLRRLGLLLAPLFHPWREDDRRQWQELRDRLRDQARALGSQTEAMKELAARMQAVEQAIARTGGQVAAELTASRLDLERWRDDMLRRQRDGQAAVGGAIKGIRQQFARKGAFNAAVLERARRVPRQAFLEQAVLDRLARIAASGRPIVAGPWTGEVGFELLYWAPFVRWFAGHYGVDPSRITVVSRGGPESWYRDIGAAYADVFEMTGSEEFVAATAALKQRHWSPFDARMVRAVARARGLRRPALLHPSAMYTLFRDFFAREGGLRHVVGHTAHRRIESPGRALVPGLPDEYVAVKFYFRPSFPRTPENVAFVQALLDEIAQTHPVVLLDSGLRLDEHEDFSDPRFRDLASLGAPITLRNNLEVQTAVVAGASGYIGTYGGFCYLAPLCGVPAVAFYADPLFYLYHRYMADVVFARLNLPPLVMLPTSASRLQRRAVLDLFAASSP